MLSKVFDVFGCVWTHLDPFGPVRMRSDAFGCVRKRMEGFGTTRDLYVFNDFFGRFWVALRVL